MYKQDIQILRMAAFELQDPSIDLVKKAGIIKSIKNWWKAKFSPEFAQQQEQVETAYNRVKEPLTDLIHQLQDLEKAFKGQDPDNVARLVSKVPSTIARVTIGLGTLTETMKDAEKAIPTAYYDEEGNEIATSDLSRVRKYTTQQVRDKAKSLLPEEFQHISIGEVLGKPIPVSSMNWYSSYSPDSFSPISPATKNNMAVRLKYAFAKYFRTKVTNEQIESIIVNGIDGFIENIKEAIFSQGVIFKVNFPKESAAAERRRGNEMWISVYVGPVIFPTNKGNITIDVKEARFNDLGLAVGSQSKRLSFEAIQQFEVLKADPGVLEV